MPVANALILTSTLDIQYSTFFGSFDNKKALSKGQGFEFKDYS
jgi:hypothetical protein